MITERDAWTINGYLGMVILTVMMGVGVLSIIYEEWGMGIIFFCGMIILATGLTVIQPNQSVIVQFAGKYVGTYRQPGPVLFIPFSKRTSISLRERIFKSEYVHVHDVEGTPMTMSIALLFKVVDAAKAVYDVENLEKYIAIQSEMSVRSLMTAYSHTELLTNEDLMQQITSHLKQDLFDRLQRAGITLTEIRLIPASAEHGNKSTADTEQLTDRILQLMESENLLPPNKEKQKVFKNKLSVSLSSD